MDLDSYEDVKRTKVLVYGPPKSGKTALVGGLAAAGFKLHWFDCENGIKTLLQPDILKPEFRKNISVYNIPDHRSLPIALDVFRKLFKGGDHKFCHAHGVANCPVCAKLPDAKWSDTINVKKLGDKEILVIDSWTQVANSALNKVTIAEYRKDEDYQTTFHDFRKQGQYLDEVLSQIQIAQTNICVISHDIDVEKSDTKEQIVPIGGTRNFSKTMAKYFDECIYVKVLNKKHSAYSSTTYSNTVLTGGRSGVKLEEGKDACLADIFLERSESSGPAVIQSNQGVKK